MRCALTAVPPPALMCSCPGSACRSSHPASQGCSRQPGTHTGEGPAHGRGAVDGGKAGGGMGAGRWRQVQLARPLEQAAAPSFSADVSATTTQVPRSTHHLCSSFALRRLTCTLQLPLLDSVSVLLLPPLCRAPAPAAPPPVAPVAGKAPTKPPTVTVQLPPPPPAPAAMRVSTSPDRLPATLPPPPPPTRTSTSPPRLVQPPAPSAAPSAAPGSSGLAAGVGSEHYSHGPLLLFPDTSALLSMLGANTDVAR